MIARFERYFPGVYYNKERWAPYTSDGYIPFRLFMDYLDQLRPLLAEDELVIALGVSQGYANARSTDPKVKGAMRRLIRKAYPRI